MDRTEFEAMLRSEGYRVVNTSVRPNLVVPNHCHDFDAKVMVLGGEITVCRDGKAEVFGVGDWCEIPAGCLHTTQVGAEGVAYLVGRATRRAG